MTKTQQIARLLLWAMAMAFITFAYYSAGWGVVGAFALIFTLAWITWQPWCPNWLREGMSGHYRNRR